MTTEEFLKYMNSGKQVTAECGVHQTMHRLSQEAIRITMEINSRCDGSKRNLFCYDAKRQQRFFRYV